MFYGKNYLKGAFSWIAYLKVFQFLIQEILNKRIRLIYAALPNCFQVVFALILAGQSEVSWNLNLRALDEQANFYLLSEVAMVHPHSIKLPFDGFLCKYIPFLLFYWRQELLAAASDHLSQNAFLNQWYMWLTYQVIFFSDHV